MAYLHSDHVKKTIAMEIENKLGYLNIDSSFYQTRISKKFENRKPYSPDDSRIIRSFIPGTVMEIFVSPGQEVRIGDDLLILDAMKMQNRLKCSTDGKVKTVTAKKGAKVSKGTVLIELE